MRRETNSCPTERNYATHSALKSVREELRRFEPPVVVFNKSHSGSRLLADSVHKHLTQANEKIRDVIDIAKPLLISLGYLKPDGLTEVARAFVRGKRKFD